ncbi:MAG: hypothetical protein GX442_10380 [Candidatus Riflebacteria bacterium]|nr:hypothetical protein [Candidatus Riflebacteria bacterium]
MASLVQEKVRAILQEEGKGILLDPRRFSNLLKDYLPENKREAFVVWRMLEAGIPQIFQQAAPRIDIPFLQTQFESVGNRFRFTEDAIANGLAVWTYALDLPWPPECTVKTLMAGLTDGAFPQLGNRVTHGLADLILKYGQTTCFALTWMEARLKKTFPLYRGEVFLLACLLERKIPQELVAIGKGKPIDLAVQRMENRILLEIPFDQAAVRWAIESWAFALGLEVPPHSQVFAGSLRARRPAAGEAKPAAGPVKAPPAKEAPAAPAGPAAGKPEEPLLRPFFVYILILACCALIYNQGEFLKARMVRGKVDPATVSARERPFLLTDGETPDEDADPGTATSVPRLDGPAAYRLGKMYFSGEEGTIDKTLARTYFAMAAEQNWPRSRAWLAYMMITGDGGPDDQEGADALIAAMTEEQNLVEQAELYSLLRRGAHGGNPIARKMVDDLAAGNGPFPVEGLPLASATAFQPPVGATPAKPAALVLPTVAAPAASRTTPVGKPPHELGAAIRSQDRKAVADLVKGADPADLSRLDDQGFAPLHEAVLAKNPAIAELLLAGKADPNVVNRDGLTPLHYAADTDQKDLATLLLQHGATVNAAGGQGATPLHQAALRGLTGMCELLLEAGADPNLADQRQQVPLHYAVLAKSPAVVGILLQAGADPNARDKDGLTPLHYAAYANLGEIATLLLQKGAAIEAAGNLGSTPLHQAAFCGWTGMCRLLVEAGADPRKEDAKGYSPIAVAYYQNHPDTHDFLVKVKTR